MLENINLRIKKFNRTTYVADGMLRLKRKIDNSLRLGFKAYNMNGGQYKLMFGRLLGSACDQLYEDSMRITLEEFFVTTNLTQWSWGMCPIEGTTGVVKNYAPTTIGDHIPAYVPGSEKWKVELYFAENESNILGGVIVYASLRTNLSLINYG
ncbi:hypothetical protein PVAND_010138 [Polypedilum vanderplanki]|uniref:Uncharacterized protein n=1 Tax=Polypedilum vanderplanki TaxID=319348 RepID=A0A9J6CEY1_POLVA|nr:hypothetical protein PVAND_010138 [Polypedilum vanderplanki]